MAPPTTTKPKPKPKTKPPKLSQTRLNMTATPQKPASATKIKTPTAKAKPNASILSFFKKASEEGLFIEEGKPGVELEEEVEEEELDVGSAEEAGEGEGLKGGIYESSPVREQQQQQQRRRREGGEEEDKEEEGRYNEAGGAVKRRRLSPGSGEGLDNPELGGKGVGESNAEAKRAAAPAVAAAAAPPAKKKPGNPFLDDDSDSDSNSDEDGTETSTARVRLPPPAFDASRERDSCGAGPAKLTSATTISRVPLLRQQTSGAELGGDGDDDDAGDIPDGDPTDDAEQLEDEDFAGEELRAMRYMEEQARLEAEAEGEEYEAMDIGDDDDAAMTESCPVCNGRLSGATPDQATEHVNSCLDGNPTPLPQPSGSVVEAEAVDVSKRFAKAAVPRPGQANPISLGGGKGEGPSTSAFAKLMSGHAEDAAWATAAAAETAARGMPAYKRTCPFYKIMPGFSICVDAFRYGAVEGCQAYFLSHFHSDHYVGLTASWTHGPIYCSKVTGSLVKSQLKTAAKYVVELEFEETVPVPDTKGVTVTMIPANHCPGSSLFLFEKTTAGRTQRILHCGDFRACPAHVEHPKLRPETVDAITGRTKQQKIDVCYLDTTYLNPRYSFPPQQDVIQACADLCARLNKSLLADDTREWDALQRRQGRGASSATESVTKFFAAAPPPSSSSTTTTKPSPPATTTTTNNNNNNNNNNNSAFTALTNAPHNHKHNPNRLLVVCGTYSIGKERICVAIAKALSTKIYATPAKIRMCKQLGDAELAALLTPDPAEAQVHMQMLMELRAETLAEYLEGYRARREFGRIVGFRPSGWNFRPSPPTLNTNGGGSGSSGGNNGSAGAVGANLPPGSLPTTQLLHGVGWRARFRAADLVPQRGATREAMCFGVPYSEHSSFRELALFVMALRIERVVPTVNVGSEASRRRMKGWIDRWVGERRRGGVVKVLEEGGERKEGGEGEGEAEGEAELLLWEGKEGKGGGVYW